MRRGRAAWHDKNDDVLYVGNSWAGTLCQDQHAHPGTSTIGCAAAQALSRGGRLPPQRLAQHLDDRQVLRYDPKADAFTAFDIPTRGSEVRYVSVYERTARCRWCCRPTAPARSP